MSQADIQAIASGDKTAQDVDLSRAADIDTLTDLQRLERFAGSGDTGKGPKNLLKDAILSDDQDKAGKDDFTPTMVDTGLMGKEGVSVDIVPFQALSAEEIMGQAKKAADELFPTIEGTNNIANPEKAVAEYRAFLEQSGVDLNNSEQKAALQKEEALLAKDKKEGAMYALLEFGFGLMAGKSPNALTNVGEAGKAVAPRLFQLQKDIRKGNERLTDARLKLAELENAQKMGIAKVSMERIEKEKERIAKANDRIAQSKASFINAFMQNRRVLETSKLNAMTNLRTAEMSRDATLKAAEIRATIPPGEQKLIQKLADEAGISFEEALDKFYKARKQDPYAILGERLGAAGKGAGLDEKQISALRNELKLKPIETNR